jgi:hypothetical protein
MSQQESNSYYCPLPPPPSYYYCQTCNGLLSDTDIFCGHCGRKTGDKPNNFLDAACGVCLAFSLALFVWMMELGISNTGSISTFLDALTGSIAVWFVALVLAIVSRRRVALLTTTLAMGVICVLILSFYVGLAAMAGCPSC